MIFYIVILLKKFFFYGTILLVIFLKLKGTLKYINDYYGIIESDNFEYRFRVDVIYGNRIFVSDRVIFLLEDNVVKMVMFDTEEVEEILDVG